MAAHGVATRMTARQAIGVLRDEGIAEARKGAGVFVRGFRPLRRRGIQRLAHDQWGNGRSIWSADTESRALEVDQVSVSEETTPAQISAVMDLAAEAVIGVVQPDYPEAAERATRVRDRQTFRGPAGRRLTPWRRAGRWSRRSWPRRPSWCGPARRHPPTLLGT